MSADRIVAGRYRLADRLGGGGMGVVWQAHDERLRRTVAVKQVILPPSLDDAKLAEIRKRTMREGRIAAKLHHPQLITVYDVIEDEGRPYLVMEYLPSTSLAKLLDGNEPLPPEEVARIGTQCAAALAAAHAAGVVHRDIKPGNILVGDNGTVKITDFGVSRVVEDVTGTVTGTFVGTPAYLAPEVAQGKDVTFASDVYSLGATLYKAVEGVGPAGKSDNPMLVLHRIASGTVNPPKKAGPLADVLLRMLSNDPAARPTMEEAKAELDAIADGRPTVMIPERPAAPEAATPAAPAPSPGTPAGPGSKQPHRKRAAVLLALVCVLVAVTTTIVVLTVNDDSGTAGNAAPQTTTQPADTGSATQEPSTTDEPTTAPPSTPSTPPSTSKPATPPANAVAAVTGYYALMPGDPDAGWTRLTPKFQQSPAGGPDGYRRYWSSISSVSASNASGSGSTVEVTVSYAFKSGRKTTERHRYQLVNQGGRWLIDSVAVLSSTDTP